MPPEETSHHTLDLSFASEKMRVEISSLAGCFRSTPGVAEDHPSTQFGYQQFGSTLQPMRGILP